MKTETFNNETLNISGGFITFNGKVVARFKLGAKAFAKHLAKHHTPAEYFAKLEAGASPLEIAESTGYVSPHVKRELKRLGYPLTPQGKRQMIQDQIAARG